VSTLIGGYVHDRFFHLPSSQSMLSYRSVRQRDRPPPLSKPLTTPQSSRLDHGFTTRSSRHCSLNAMGRELLRQAMGPHPPCTQLPPSLCVDDSRMTLPVPPGPEGAPCSELDVALPRQTCVTESYEPPVSFARRACQSAFSRLLTCGFVSIPQRAKILIKQDLQGVALLGVSGALMALPEPAPPD